MTTLCGINFGPVWDAPGVRGWFGEGYWFHPLYHLLPGFTFDGSTRVAKTTTLNYNAGNMPIGTFADGWPPKDYFPACIKTYVWSGRTFNAIGLSGPGLQALLSYGLVAPGGTRMVSFMPVGYTPEERETECRRYAELMKRYLNPVTRAGLGQQFNLTCPNTGHNVGKINVGEVMRMLDILAPLELPTMLKINLHARHEDVAAIAKHPACDGFCQTNAIQFGTLAGIDWARLYPNGSPLAQFAGGGGYSGPELVALVGRYIYKALQMGIDKPWNAGGGIRSADDVEHMVEIGGLRRGIDSVFFASAAMVRPWNIRGIIRRAHELLAQPPA